MPTTQDLTLSAPCPVPRPVQCVPHRFRSGSPSATDEDRENQDEHAPRLCSQAIHIPDSATNCTRGLGASARCRASWAMDQLRICTGPYRSEHRSCYSLAVHRFHGCPEPSHRGWFLTFRARSGSGPDVSTTTTPPGIAKPTAGKLGSSADSPLGWRSPCSRGTKRFHRVRHCGSEPLDKAGSAAQRPRLISSNILRSRVLSTAPSRRSDSPEVSGTCGFSASLQAPYANCC